MKISSGHLYTPTGVKSEPSDSVVHQVIGLSTKALLRILQGASYSQHIRGLSVNTAYCCSERVRESFNKSVSANQSFTEGKEPTSPRPHAFSSGKESPPLSESF